MLFFYACRNKGAFCPTCSEGITKFHCIDFCLNCSQFWNYILSLFFKSNQRKKKIKITNKRLFPEYLANFKSEELYPIVKEIYCHFFKLLSFSSLKYLFKKDKQIFLIFLTTDISKCFVTSYTEKNWKVSHWWKSMTFIIKHLKSKSWKFFWVFP